MNLPMFSFLAGIASATPLLVGATFMLVPTAHGGLAWALQAITGLIFATIWFFVAPTHIFGTAASIGSIIGTIVVLCAIALWKIRALWPFSAAPIQPLKVVLPSLAVMAFAAMGALYLFRQPDEPPVALEMPLRNVQWYVAHGGPTLLTNPHHSVPAQRHANDIVVLGPGGKRANGLRPQALDDYYAYRVPVVSPCTGRVLAARNDLPDQAIGQADSVNLAGNFVAIACHGVTVLLAHLRAGSVEVKAGDEVRSGQALGQIGNSGNTSEPHLHIHAIRGESADLRALLSSGEGVPILFDGRYLRRGSRP